MTPCPPSSEASRSVPGLSLSVEQGRGNVDAGKAPENSSTEFLGQPARGGSVWSEPCLWRGCQIHSRLVLLAQTSPSLRCQGQSVCLASLPAQPELFLSLAAPSKKPVPQPSSSQFPSRPGTGQKRPHMDPALKEPPRSTRVDRLGVSAGSWGLKGRSLSEDGPGVGKASQRTGWVWVSRGSAAQRTRIPGLDGGGGGGGGLPSVGPEKGWDAGAGAPGSRCRSSWVGMG